MPIVAIENAWDALKRDLSARLGSVAGRDTPMIAPYRGFGTESELWCRGRVLEDEGVMTALHSDSLLTNLRHTLKRYETDEVPGARLTWRFAEGSEHERHGEVVTDEEGYFDIRLQPGPLPNAPWHDVHVRLREAPGYDLPELGATCRVRVPGPNARFAVVSDIDDTIVYTGAHDFLKHWRTVVANSAQGREGYEGLPELYRFLSDDERNPFFYVSSSPWNLHDLFERYMALNGIPLGPMLLRDFGLDETKWLTGGHDGHKTAQIERLLAAYPHLSFVLVGDSGQRDPAIYASIAESHPERVLAVVIHEVTPHEKEVAAMRERLGGRTPHLVTDSYGAAREWIADLLPPEPSAHEPPAHERSAHETAATRRTGAPARA